MQDKELGKLILKGLLITEDGRLVGHDGSHVGSEGMHILAVVVGVGWRTARPLLGCLRESQT